jgi:hypothetical protein
MCDHPKSSRATRCRACHTRLISTDPAIKANRDRALEAYRSTPAEDRRTRRRKARQVRHIPREYWPEYQRICRVGIAPTEAQRKVLAKSAAETVRREQVAILDRYYGGRPAQANCEQAAPDFAARPIDWELIQAQIDV